MGLFGGASAQAQQCVNDYERALSAMKQNAGMCAQHNKLMTALTDAPGNIINGEGSPNAPKTARPRRAASTVSA